MELTRTLMEIRSMGWSFVYQLVALLCLVVVIYKFTILLAKKRAAQKNFEAFPGPPGHWLFGHVLEVPFYAEH